MILQGGGKLERSSVTTHPDGSFSMLFAFPSFRDFQGKVAASAASLSFLLHYSTASSYWLRPHCLSPIFCVVCSRTTEVSLRYWRVGVFVFLSWEEMVNEREVMLFIYDFVFCLGGGEKFCYLLSAFVYHFPPPLPPLPPSLCVRARERASEMSIGSVIKLEIHSEG